MNSDLAARRAAVLRKRLAKAGLTADAAAAATVVRRADRATAPLSPAQRRMWVLDWLDPSGIAYNVCLHVTFAGPLDVPALRAAVRSMVVRHEVLRTRYPLGTDQLPRQHIDPAAEVAEFPVPLIDLRDRPPGAVEDLVDELARHRFDLARDWPLRTVLYRTGEQEYRLGLVVHHIAWDGGTWPVISAELTRGYAEAAGGAATGAAAPLDLQYGDFAAALADAPVRPADRDYWLDRLTDLPGPLALPADHPGAGGGGRRSMVFGPERTARFTALAAREGVTPFTVLLAAFGALLNRYGAGTDVPIGSATMNRDSAKAQALIGNFGNTLVLRLDTSGDPSFTELVRRADTVCSGGFAHQDMPYDQVVAALRERGGSRDLDPFNVMLLFLTQGLVGPQLPGVRTAWRNVHNGTKKFDLSLEAFLIDGDLEIEASYSGELFSAERVDELLVDLRALLDAVAAQPATPLSALSVR
ncbi:MAG TPA: condensation domain-containing protein, partial [Pseudonocardia sp.]|nr:condensation domain-containing protein [Pseudonocardia sp.]